MLRSMKDMEDYTIGATDGSIGRVKDFYFDDQAWVIRYLIVATGDESPQRKVLISPISIGRPNWSEKIFPVSLTRAQVRKSPDIDTDKPVSRQHEMGYLGYYGYGTYWGGGGLWGAGIYPDELQAGLQNEVSGADARHPGDDVHLRSGNEIMRYYVHASDGDLGHVQGLIVDEFSSLFPMRGTNKFPIAPILLIVLGSILFLLPMLNWALNIRPEELEARDSRRVRPTAMPGAAA